MRLVPRTLELCKGHKICGLASDTARPRGKFAYMVAAVETPDPLLQIDVQSDLDLLVASCDSMP
jgi:hypothetical protein